MDSTHFSSKVQFAKAGLRSCFGKVVDRKPWDYTPNSTTISNTNSTQSYNFPTTQATLWPTNLENCFPLGCLIASGFRNGFPYSKFKNLD